MSKAALVLEIAAWSAGALMISAYGGARWRHEVARDHAIAAFNDVRAQQRYVDGGGAGARPQRIAHEHRAVDTSTWSPQRIEAYRSNGGRGSAPAAVLSIPRLNLLVPVFEGVNDLNLSRGAARIEGTARIGGRGNNIGIAAHRDGFFRALKDVRPGDVLYLEQPTATRAYTVVETRIVDPDRVSVLHDTPAPAVTLVTCYPFYFVGPAPKRFIVHARQE